MHNWWKFFIFAPWHSEIGVTLLMARLNKGTK